MYQLISRKHLRFTSLIALIAIVLHSNEATAQTLQWAHGLTVQDNDSWAYGVAANASGNIYMAGSFRGSIDLDPGSGTDWKTVQTTGKTDVYIVKLDPDGNYIWGKTFGGPGGDWAWDLALDDSSNVYISGGFGDSIDLDPSANSHWLGIGTTYESGYVVKLDSSGNFVWGRVFGSSNQDRAYTIDVRDSVVAVGGFTRGGADLNPNAGTYSYTSNGWYDGIFVSLTTNGDFLGAGGFGGSSTDEVRGIKLDDSLNIYIAGRFAGNVDFDPSSGTSNMNAGTYQDACVVKYDMHGNLQWARNRAPTFNYGYLAHGMDWDDSGYLLVGGSGQKISGTLGTIYLEKFDRQGNTEYFKSMSSSGSVLIPEVYSLALDELGNCYITGLLAGTIDMDPTSNTYSIQTTTNNGYDTYLASYDSVGDLNWAYPIGAPNAGSSELGTEVAIDPSGNLLFVGDFRDDLDLDVDSAITDTIETGDNETSSFIAKYEQCFSGYISDISSSADSICPNDTVTLSITGELISNDNWYWYTDITASPIDSGSSISFNTAQTDTVYVRASGGCAPDSDFDSIRVAIFDTTSPVPSVTSLDTLFGDCSATVSSIPQATDNCAGTLQAVTTDSLNYDTQGTFTITWNYTDDLGNVSSQSQVVVVDDVTPPVPDDSSLDTVFAECQATVSTTPTATDVCSGTVQGTTSDALTYSTQGTHSITWTYTDGEGNSVTQTQIVVIDDVTDPVPNSASLDTLAGECSVSVSTTPTATDACEGTITATTSDPTSYSTQGTHTVTWSFDDGNGNTATQTQVVYIEDTQAPVPANTTLDTVFAQCSTTVSTVPTAQDNCGGTITATTTDPLTYSNIGTYTIAWEYADGNGNDVSQTQVVSISDTMAPIPDNALDTIFGQCSASISGTPTATDSCEGTITATTNDALSYSTQGSHVVTWTYTDFYGNSSTQTQVVEVADTEAPIPSLTALDTVFGQCSAAITTTPTAVDSCEGTVNATTNDALSYSSQGTHIVTWTYTDSHGNSATQQQVVEIEDTEAPIPSVSALDTVFGQCSASIGSTPTAIDSCDGNVNGTTNDALSYSMQGVYTVTWSFADAQGNTVTQGQIVVVEDTESPVPSQTVLDTVFGICDATVSTTPTAVDNCNGTLDGVTSDALFYDTDGTYTITWTYTDSSGNSVQQMQVVVVDDTVSPTVLCPNDEDICGTEASDIGPVDTTDNCAVSSLTYLLSGATSAAGSGDASVETFDPGTTVVTYTVEDASGNTSSCSFTVSSVVVDVGVVSTTTSISAKANSAQYQWIDCEDFTQIAGENGQTFNPSQNGTYAVQVTQNGCVDTSACVAITKVGIDERQAQEAALSVTPNPTADLALLHVSLVKTEQCRIRLFDQTGRWMADLHEGKFPGGDTMLPVDLSTHASGVYLIVMESDHGFAQVRVVIE